MTEIHLKIDIEALKAIYFGNNNDTFFFGPTTKRQSIYLTIAIIVYPFFAFYSLNKDDNWQFVFGTIFLGLIAYDYWKVASPIIKWRKSVNQFIQKAQNIETLKFSYNDIYFIHIQDNEILKQDWSIIQRAIINDQMILLESDCDVILPKNAMNESEFQLLSDLIFSKVKNVKKE